MNLQSDNRNRTETECLRRHPEVFYVNGHESNVHVDEPYFNLNRNRREYEQNAENYGNNYNKEDLWCNRYKTTNTFITPSNRYSYKFNEPQKPSPTVSSVSICSRCIYSKSEYIPEISKKRKVQIEKSKSGFSIKQKRDDDVQSKLSFTNNSVKFCKNGQTDEKLYCDKTTYCRPVVNLYNEEFLFKTMEKNAKLRKLVRELVNARQKERKIESWNNYINDLKRKHSKDIEIKHDASLQYISDEFRTHETLESMNNTEFTCNQSNLCQNLIKDFYKSLDLGSPYCDNKRTFNEYAEIPKTDNPFKTSPICFPTSSQGRMIMLERERMKRFANRGYKPLFKTINEDKKLESENVRLIRENRLHREKPHIIRNSRSTNTVLESISTQTETKAMESKNVDFVISRSCNTYPIEYQKGCTNEVNNQETAPDFSTFTNSNLKRSSLVCIEEKLDNLMLSINTFLVELKSKTARNKYFDHHNKLGKRNINYTRSDSGSMARKEKIVCGFIDDSSRTTRNSSMDHFNRFETIDENLSKINDILLNKIGKNQLITLKGSSLGETYHPCSVQISVTIPTKEISTEVTRSLSKTANLKNSNIVIEEIPKLEEKRIAMAVNTDPLNILAMLRVSTEEVIRRLMSYVPTINYYSYLPRLQGPHSRVMETQYVCNICGAAFMKPSALTDHIQKHELGTTRDCCVCRHVLDLPHRRPGLFKCQYCGQRFTRAYCCELHQEECAKRLGKIHDVPSSLMLLR